VGHPPKPATSSGSVTNPLQYSGREFDSETGLLYLRATYYDPSTGRFTSEDPIGFRSGDENHYRYVFNTSTRFTDPSGLKVYRCSRKAIVNVLGFNLNGLTGFKHHWIKTDTKEAGLGPAGGGIPGVPGQPGAQGTSSDSIGEPTTVNDHSGASDAPGAECEEVKDVDEDCVNKHLQIGSYEGPFGIPPTNNCQTFAGDILDACSTKPKPKGTSLPIDEQIRLRGPLF
jgi:RHS repeat-associated protein